MKVKGIVFEDFVNYKKPSMYIIFPNCSFKCDHECGRPVCQNGALANEEVLDVSKKEIIEDYLTNPITEAIVLGGLEPFDSPLDLLPFIDTVRRVYECNDDIVIYTGYTEEELQTGQFGSGPPLMEQHYYESVCFYDNIIIKFGRYKPNEEPHFDKVLGVKLASPNQYARKFNDLEDKG